MINYYFNEDEKHDSNHWRSQGFATRVRGNLRGV